MKAADAQNDATRLHPVPMEIRFSALLGWVLPVGVLTGLVGLYPTYRWAGGDGILALIAAGAAALLVVLISGFITCILARRGPAMAAGGFLFASLLRVVVCLILTAAAWQAFDLPGKVVFLWACLFYGLMILCEAGWVSRALSRDARRVHLGEIRRERIFGRPAAPPGPAAVESDSA